MIVDPGFDYSTLAVAQGYFNAFSALGYEVMEYETLNYLNVARKGLLNASNLETVGLNTITELAMAPIINQVINDQVDVVLMVHGYWMNPSVVVSLRNLRVKTGLILTDDPMQVDASRQWGKYYEYIFTNDRNTVECHHNCHYLPVAVDNTVFFPRIVPPMYQSDILIAGSLYKERTEFIDSSPELIDVLLKYNTKIVGARKREFRTKSLNKFLGENKISIEEMAKYIAGAKIVIDIPKDEYADNVFGKTNKREIKASCLSPRIFECFASRTLVLTSNERMALFDLFKPIWDDMDLYYTSAKDLARQIDLYVPEKRMWDKIGAYNFVMKEHTYEARVKEIEKVMKIHPSVKDIRRDDPINITVAERWEDDWKKNFEFCKENRYYSSMHSVANLITTKKDKEINIVSNGPSLGDCRTIDRNAIGYYLNDAWQYANPKVEHCCAIVIHPNDDVYERCFKDSEPGMSLIASTLANWRVIERFFTTWQNIFFFNTGCEYGIKKEVYEYTKYPILPSGYTVAYAAMAIAAYTGAKKINLYGVDFCYLNNLKYVHENLNYEKLDKRLVTMVPDAKGCPVLTDQVMLKSRDACLTFIEQRPDIEFNVYGRGILIGKNLKNLNNIF